MDYEYDWRFTPPGAPPGRAHAEPARRRRASSTRRWSWTPADHHRQPGAPRWPVSADDRASVAAAIYWQAARLWWNGCRSIPTRPAECRRVRGSSTTVAATRPPRATPLGIFPSVPVGGPQPIDRCGAPSSAAPAWRSGAGVPRPQRRRRVKTWCRRRDERGTWSAIRGFGIAGQGMSARRGRGWAARTWAAGGLVLMAAAGPALALDQTLVAAGSTWRYRDGGQSPGAGWTLPATTTAAGRAARRSSATATATRRPSSATAATPPPRRSRPTSGRTFTVAGAGAFQRLDLRLLRDDGAVVYLNGVELRRDNLPAGAIDAATLAARGHRRRRRVAFVASHRRRGAAARGRERAGGGGAPVERPPAPTSASISSSSPPTAGAVTRGPYLQRGTPTSMVVRWRTDLADRQPRALRRRGRRADARRRRRRRSTTEHVVRSAHLAPDTRYFYAVGTSGGALAGGDATTLPHAAARRAPRRRRASGWSAMPAPARPARRARARRLPRLRRRRSARPVADARRQRLHRRHRRRVPDAASSTSIQPLLRTSVLWPTLGNHDGQSAPTRRRRAVPTTTSSRCRPPAQAGGVASGHRGLLLVRLRPHPLHLPRFVRDQPRARRRRC